MTNDSDFVFNFLDPNAVRARGSSGFIVAANVETFPAVVGNGMALGESLYRLSSA